MPTLLDELVGLVDAPRQRKHLSSSVYVGRIAPFLFVDVPGGASDRVKVTLRRVDQTLPSQRLAGLSPSTEPSLTQLFANRVVFTVVGHPLTRLHQGFHGRVLAKFVEDSSGRYRFEGTSNRALLAGMLNHGLWSIGSLPMFDNFVRFVCTHQQDHQRSPYWRQLGRLAWPQHIPYDYVIHAESLGVDFPSVLHSISPDFSTRRIPAAPTDQLPPWKTELSDKTLELFVETYQKDLDIFGYEGTPPVSSDMVLQSIATAQEEPSRSRILLANCAVNYTSDAHVDFQATPAEYRRSGGSNFGDHLVCESTLRVISERAPFENVGLDAELSDERCEYLSSEYDALVIRGSNYLSSTHDLGHWADTIDRLDIPVTLFGIGAQTSARSLFRLPDGTERFLKKVVERGGPIGVRGEFTAELLANHNIAATPLGCPTIIRTGCPEIEVHHSSRLAKWGLTVNRFLTGDYASSNELTRRLQAQLTRSAIRDARAVILSQGELPETLVAMGSSDPALLDLIAIGLGVGDLPDARTVLAEMIEAHLHTGDWTKAVQRLDLVVGFRLHGNIIALGAGVPTVFVSYDSRSAEMVDLLRVPFVDIQDAPSLVVDELYETADFAAFEDRYRHLFRQWRDFIAAALPDRTAFFDVALESCEPTSGLRSVNQTNTREPHRLGSDTDRSARGEIRALSARLDHSTKALWNANKKISVLEDPNSKVAEPTQTEWGLTR